MKRLVEFPLEGGGFVTAEVDNAEQKGGTVRGVHAAEVAVKAQQTFEAAMEGVKPTAAAIIAKLRELSDRPEQIAVEFGIKLSAAAGVVLASSGLEANFKVTLTWKHDR
ncbi:MAG TPA: CU044_2847 family protein [Blastocatellia bacterium]|nr:CU044_2847 family protein [Blastocatellia bacterium]